MVSALPQWGLNRLDFRSVASFAEDAARIERLGWDWAFIPDSQLLLPDPYVMLAGAAQATRQLGLGVLMTNPVTRDATVTASSIATVDALAPGRTLLGFGAGDTAVRLIGRTPATVARLESDTRKIRSLLASESVDFGAAEPIRLRHARPVPVWIAAGGPRTLRMAGAAADGVFVRVGTHPENLVAAVTAVRDGAAAAGRDPASVRLGAVFHTILTADAEHGIRIGRAMAAGYYEVTPSLFERPGLAWEGPPIEELQREVRPDFHHTADLDHAGALVEFLPEAAADAFALHGTPADVRAQLAHVFSLGIPFEIVVPHPVLPSPEFADVFAQEVIAALR